MIAIGKIREAPVINVAVTEEAVRAIKDAIIEIVKACPDSTAIVAAMGAFERAASISHAQISNCTFSLAGRR